MKILDFVAVGLGPFNLSLACLTDHLEDLSGVVLEQRSRFDWHPGMMIDGVTLQTPFMSDLVTLADPTNPYSYLNYSKLKGRLYSFYIRESFFLLRQEYNQYCQWATEQLNNLRFNTQVQSVVYLPEHSCYHIQCVEQSNGEAIDYFARQLVLGTGPAPHLPENLEPLKTALVHSSQYLPRKAMLQNAKSIAVVGSGQSAAEIFYDLLQEAPEKGYHVTWLTRANRFFPLEYTKLTLEMTSPEYVDYFYNLPSEKRDELIGQQQNLYKGINSCLINDIYDLLYQQGVAGYQCATLATNSALVDITATQEQQFCLSVHHKEQEQDYELNAEQVVMATGYSYKVPAFLKAIESHINWDEKGRYAVDRLYSIDNNKSIFVQNAEIHTHGFVTPDLGMACYRNSQIINQLAGREVYRVEQRIAFQEFGVPSRANVASKKKDVAC
ncbi:lysine N(6)-hydroxylase/L-ornithine N(5)-oxygenase family protein [Thalassotalea euphylliae]|uniref:lysine N(6)-hydroxylase/L-ornithine N(5)-oxygenase family protein n=1 Tax=Thalassotalea euphylliae TaxID=1655234 RepID=UPI00363C45B9